MVVDFSKGLAPYRQAFALIGAYEHFEVPGRSIIGPNFSVGDLVPFSGMFFVREAHGKGVGALIEDQGASTLEGNLQFDRGEFDFVKQYVRSGEQITYKFKREGDLWIGVYNTLDLTVRNEGAATLKVFEAGSEFLGKLSDLADAPFLPRR